MDQRESGLEQGDKLMVEGKFRQALGCLYTCNLRKGETFLRIGNCHHKLGNFDEAVDAFIKAQKLGGCEAKVLHFNRANSLRAGGRFQEAVQCYNSVLQIDQNYQDALLNLAKLYRKMGKYLEAQHLYEKLQELSPMNHRVLYNKSVLLKEMGLLDKALIFIDKAILFSSDQVYYKAKYHLLKRIDPNSPEIQQVSKILASFKRFS